MSKLSGAALVAIAFSMPAWAHHGFGRFDPSRDIELEGTLTGVDFVNPHAYLYFDAITPQGAVTKMRCEMRAATVLRRSGWTAEMFVSGSHVNISGNPHRDDPASCYVETLTIGDAPALERYQQLTSASQTAPADRPVRLPDGKLNLAGEWAQEQYLIARPPEGRGGLVPKSMVAAVEAGEVAFADVPSAGWGAQPVTLTAAGEAAAEVLRAVPPQDNPRARCEITSILFDWVFDGPINRITQGEDAITIEYGRGLTRTVHMNMTEHPADVAPSRGTRTVHMNMTEHPADVAPSRGGHSIGRWDGDVLVVDTTGFLPGSLAGAVPHSDRLRVVERFTLDAQRMALKRDYVAEDPLFFTDTYAGSDTVLPADAPFAEDRCEELGYRIYSEEAE